MSNEEKIVLLKLMSTHCKCLDKGHGSCDVCEFAVKEIIQDLEKTERYRWHDLKENPEDLPEGNNKDLVDVILHNGISVDTIGNVRNGALFNGKTCVAWKYREPLECE